MADLIYSGLTSLDGYTADAAGNFDWAAPDLEVHAAVNDLTRDVGTYVYGRRMYEIMKYWQTADQESGHSDVTLDWARIWQAADKIVISASLDAAETPKTRIEPAYDAATLAGWLREADQPFGIGGPTVAAQAVRDGLVTEIQQFLAPVVVGGGLRFLPDDARLDLDLVEHRAFASGFVLLRYRVRG